jgi:hypothetical protein
MTKARLLALRSSMARAGPSAHTFDCHLRRLAVDATQSPRLGGASSNGRRAATRVRRSVLPATGAHFAALEKAPAPRSIPAIARCFGRAGRYFWQAAQELDANRTLIPLTSSRVQQRIARKYSPLTAAHQRSTHQQHRCSLDLRCVDDIGMERRSVRRSGSRRPSRMTSDAPGRSGPWPMRCAKEHCRVVPFPRG